jgi:cytochrome bd-type quinol oxidase subunit 2
MDRILFFNLLQVLASGYALLRGGAPERLTGAALLLAAIGTRLIMQQAEFNYLQLEAGVLAIDVALLCILAATAVLADRYWTFWLTALHALGTGAHVAKALDPSVLPTAYGILAAAWSYPMLLLLAVGTRRHRLRLDRSGGDLDWSLQGR